MSARSRLLGMTVAWPLFRLAVARRADAMLVRRVASREVLQPTKSWLRRYAVDLEIEASAYESLAVDRILGKPCPDVRTP